MKDAIVFKTAYGYDSDKESLETGLECKDASLARESFAVECDINEIVRRFGLTGQLPTGVVVPTYVDFDGVVDFHSAMNLVAQANEAFDALPAEVRARFVNDPGKLVEFVSQEENRAEAEKLGLVVAKPKEEKPPAAAAESKQGEEVPPPAAA